MLTPMQVQSKNKRPLKTMGDLRLYAQGINPVLVKLDQYEATRLLFLRWSSLGFKGETKFMIL